MPSGTGKTVTLLSLILAYQAVHTERTKLIYCSRTVPEIDKALLELKRLIAYREKMISEEAEVSEKLKLNLNSTPFYGIGLSSRRNLCVNPSALSEKVGKAVDAKCHSMTASWVRNRAAQHPGEKIELCDYFEKLERASDKLLVPTGVYTLDDLKDYGREQGICPYFLARKMLNQATVIIYSYYYLLDPKVAELVSKELPRDAIVIFDEAHNIDNVCIESLSIDISRFNLESGSRSLQKLSDKIEDIKQRDVNKLRNEYESLVEGLRKAQKDRLTDRVLANPIVSDDMLNEAIPGNIRKAEHFLALLRRFLEFLRLKMKTQHVTSESPASFLQHIREMTFIERKPLRMCSERLGSLVQTLELNNLEELSSLQRIADFATIVSTYLNGFTILFEPFENLSESGGLIPNPILHLCCLDATIAMRPVFNRFDSVVITSGTLSPLDMYPRLLDFNPVLMETFPMTLTRNSVSPMIVTRGADQVAISSRFQVRNDPAVVRNYGALLVEFCKVVPDGLVAFFPSYIYLESIVSIWQEMGIINQILQYKLLFIETPDNVETSIALESYRAACENGRGAVLLSVARGKVSEGIDFTDHYGRAVIMFGIPYQYTESRILKARLEFMRENYQIRENDFLSFDALRHAAQCLGRVLRGKQDYGLMILADKRYSRPEKRNKLPRWISQSIPETHVNLSTDMAIQLAKQFFRQMAQPQSQEDQLGFSLWTENEVVSRELQRKELEFADYPDDFMEL